MKEPPLRAPIVHESLLRLRSLHLPERLETSFDQHGRIVRPVIEGDADEAEAVSRRHAARVLEDALAVVRTAAP